MVDCPMEPVRTWLVGPLNAYNLRLSSGSSDGMPVGSTCLTVRWIGIRQYNNPLSNKTTVHIVLYLASSGMIDILSW